MGRSWNGAAGLVLVLAATTVATARVVRRESALEVGPPGGGGPGALDAGRDARDAAAGGECSRARTGPAGTPTPWEVRECLAGVVLDPGGVPVAGALVVARDGDATREGRTDAVGRFELEAPGPRGCTLSASDPRGRLAPVTVRDAPPGARALVLRLRPTPGFALRVRGPDGAPVETFAAAVTVGRGEVRAFHPHEPRPGGTLDVEAPPTSFHVEVRSDGCAPARLGPFDGSAPPAEVEVRLEPAPPDA